MAMVLVGCESPRVDKASAETSQAALELQKQRELAIAKDRREREARERARTPRPSISNNYNDPREDLIKLFMTGDPKAAWVLGERAPNKIEKYKWWTLATMSTMLVVASTCGWASTLSWKVAMSAKSVGSNSPSTWGVSMKTSILFTPG